jgi:hypothetical protein
MPRLLSLSCTLLGWISLYAFNFPHVMAQDLSVPNTWKVRAWRNALGDKLMTASSIYRTLLCSTREMTQYLWPNVR